MKPRKSMRDNRILNNRYWRRGVGGGFCDVCGYFLAGFMTPHVNKVTKRRLCADCYEKGES